MSLTLPVWRVLALRSLLDVDEGYPWCAPLLRSRTHRPRPHQAHDFAGHFGHGGAVDKVQLHLRECVDDALQDWPAPKMAPVLVVNALGLVAQPTVALFV